MIHTMPQPEGNLVDWDVAGPGPQLGCGWEIRDLVMTVNKMVMFNNYVKLPESISHGKPM